MISLHLAISILCISLITSFSCVFASRFSWVPVVLCRAGRDAEGSVWVGGKLMRRPGVRSYSGKGFSLTVYVLENVSFGELVSLSPDTLQHYEGRKWRRPYCRDVFASATAQGAALGWETLALLQVGDRNGSKWWEAKSFPPFALIGNT